MKCESTILDLKPRRCKEVRYEQVRDDKPWASWLIRELDGRASAEVANQRARWLSSGDLADGELAVCEITGRGCLWRGRRLASSLVELGHARHL